MLCALSSLLPLSGPTSLQKERPSCPQEIPAQRFSRQEALWPPSDLTQSREICLCPPNPLLPCPPTLNSPASPFSVLKGHFWRRQGAIALGGHFPAGGKPQGSTCKQEVRAGAEVNSQTAVNPPCFVSSHIILLDYRFCSINSISMSEGMIQ